MDAIIEAYLAVAYWIGTGAGKSGLGFSYIVRKHEAMVELYIDRGKDAEEENKAIFDELHNKKTEIEKAFGGTPS